MARSQTAQTLLEQILPRACLFRHPVGYLVDKHSACQILSKYSLGPHFSMLTSYPSPLSALAFELTTREFPLSNPLEAFRNAADRDDLFWLDTASPVEHGAWSYLGTKPVECLQIDGDSMFHTTYRSDGAPTVASISPIQLLRRLQPRPLSRAGRPEGPPFCGGWVGFWGYSGQKSSRNLPRLSLGYFDTILAFSHEEQRWWGAATLQDALTDDGKKREARHKISRLIEQFASPPKARPLSEGRTECRRIKTNCPRDAYLASVRRALEYIGAGDIYQINLAQQFTVPWAESSAALYLRMRQESPSAHGAFLGPGLVGQQQGLCSISPELFLRKRGRSVLTRPIKGTRPRGQTPQDTIAARHALESSVKERAELNMIVDLERNDLGRVCEPGSIEVLSAGKIEELPTLLHRVATVRGRLRPGLSPLRLLAATFPGGSITGAPKIRAMQIIDELEPAPRGPYCGAIGWMGLDGDLELSIAIRTALHDGAHGLAHYWAGSGIVADSDPLQEYEETLHKATAFFRATNAQGSPEF